MPALTFHSTEIAAMFVLAAVLLWLGRKLFRSHRYLGGAVIGFGLGAVVAGTLTVLVLLYGPQ